MNPRKASFIILITGVAIGLFSCKSQEVRDAEVKIKIEATIPEGVTVGVANGVATLRGTFPDDSSKESAIESAGAIAGVRSVIDSATITPLPEPIQVSADQQLHMNAIAAVSDYPGVAVSVREGVLTLTGNVERGKIPQLMQAIHALHASKVENRLVIK